MFSLSIKASVFSRNVQVYSCRNTMSAIKICRAALEPRLPFRILKSRGCQNETRGCSEPSQGCGGKKPCKVGGRRKRDGGRGGGGRSETASCNANVTVVFVLDGGAGVGTCAIRFLHLPVERSREVKEERRRASSGGGRRQYPAVPYRRFTRGAARHDRTGRATPPNRPIKSDRLIYRRTGPGAAAAPTTCLPFKCGGGVINRGQLRPGFDLGPSGR